MPPFQQVSASPTSSLFSIFGQGPHFPFRRVPLYKLCTFFLCQGHNGYFRGTSACPGRSSLAGWRGRCLSQLRTHSPCPSTRTCPTACEPSSSRRALGGQVPQVALPAVNGSVGPWLPKSSPAAWLPPTQKKGARREGRGLREAFGAGGPRGLYRSSAPPHPTPRTRGTSAPSYLSRCRSSQLSSGRQGHPPYIEMTRERLVLRGAGAGRRGAARGGAGRRGAPVVARGGGAGRDPARGPPRAGWPGSLP